MPFSMKLWQVSAKDLHEVEKTKLDKESRLEEWVRKDPSILGIDVLIIGQQVKTSSAKYIDLLGMDPDANLVVLELKRDRTPRDVVAQALDYTLRGSVSSRIRTSTTLRISSQGRPSGSYSWSGMAFQCQRTST